MLWIKEVEMADSVDGLKYSKSRAGRSRWANFKLLDARIASSLNKIIQNSYFKKKVSLEKLKAQKKDRFLRGRQIAFMIYDYFRITGAHDTVLDYADLFTITLRNDDVQEFDTRWDEILLLMSNIPIDDGQEDGVSKAGLFQAAADPRGSRTCVCANTLFPKGWRTQGRKGETHVLPWYRRVGVV